MIDSTQGSGLAQIESNAPLGASGTVSTIGEGAVVASWGFARVLRPLSALPGGGKFLREISVAKRRGRTLRRAEQAAIYWRK